MSSIKVPIPSTRRSASNALKGWPLLRLGFRPFYLAGALLAALWVPLWVAGFLGALTLSPAVPMLYWHAHEMIFGFAGAIIIGFLMTAGRNWTGLATPRGPLLGGLVLLWLAARLASLGPTPWLYAALDVALLPVVAVIFTRLLLKVKNTKNLPLAGMLLLLGVLNALFHLAANGVLNLSPLVPVYAGLGVIIMIETVITGRVIPGFTMSAIPGVKLVTPVWVERLTLGLTAAGLLLWVLAPASVLGALVLMAAALAHAVRLFGWRSWVTRSKPILWILHAAYAWIPLGLFFLGLAQLGWVVASVGIHALGLGATGGLIIGMITRTARGHTGRPIAASGTEVLAYGLVLLAAVIRVLGSLMPAQWYALFLVLAASVWSLAFVLYLWKFTPWLVHTRLDGLDG